MESFAARQPRQMMLLLGPSALISMLVVLFRQGLAMLVNYLLAFSACCDILRIANFSARGCVKLMQVASGRQEAGFKQPLRNKFALLSTSHASNDWSCPLVEECYMTYSLIARQK